MLRLFALLCRNWKRVVLALVVLLALLLGKAWYDTMRDPEVLRTEVALRGMAADAEPVRAVLISDIHVAGPDMPPERLVRIVAQVNALEPDVVLIAGDLVSEKGLGTHVYTPEEIVAPLGGLEAPLGVIVAPGNHDHWFDWPGLRAELVAHDIRVLQNEAAQVGTLVIGGVDDAFTGRDDVAATVAAMQGLQGGRLLLTHSPDIFPQVPDDISLVLAGHTHCGQVSLPIVGPLSYYSDYGDRFGCGEKVEAGQTVIVGAGLGTSVLPMRFGTHPQVWVVELVAEWKKAAEPESPAALGNFESQRRLGPFT